MNARQETAPTAHVELWTLYQWLCLDCPIIDGTPGACGEAETLTAAQRAIIRHKTDVHGEWDPAPTRPTGDS